MPGVFAALPAFRIQVQSFKIKVPIVVYFSLSLV